MPKAGLGIAPGHAGVVAIDMDSDDPGILAAIFAVLERSPYAKRASRGFTGFYRMDGTDFMPSRHFARADKGVPILDILGHGTQTVMPPSWRQDLASLQNRWDGERLSRCPVLALPAVHRPSHADPSSSRPDVQA